MTSKSARSSRSTTATRSGRGGTLTWVLGAFGVAVALSVLFLIFVNSNAPADDPAAASPGATQRYDVGSPGPGEPAPDFTLAGTTGEQVSLSDYRGESVLLYFQEGLMCQPCWDQITSLEDEAASLEAAGVDAVLSITTDPIELIERKTRDMGLTTPVLSDPDLGVSQQYETNLFGMMGDSRNGHSFILVGPDGTIQWRADYGGAPNYTMYVPVDQLLSDLKEGVK